MKENKSFNFMHRLLVFKNDFLQLLSVMAVELYEVELKHGNAMGQKKSPNTVMQEKLIAHAHNYRRQTFDFHGPDVEPNPPQVSPLMVSKKINLASSQRPKSPAKSTISAATNISLPDKLMRMYDRKPNAIKIKILSKPVENLDSEPGIKMDPYLRLFAIRSYGSKLKSVSKAKQPAPWETKQHVQPITELNDFFKNCLEYYSSA